MDGGWKKRVCGVVKYNPLLARTKRADRRPNIASAVALLLLSPPSTSCTHLPRARKVTSPTTHCGITLQHAPDAGCNSSGGLRTGHSFERVAYTDLDPGTCTGAVVQNGEAEWAISSDRKAASIGMEYVECIQMQYVLNLSSVNWLLISDQT